MANEIECCLSRAYKKQAHVCTSMPQPLGCTCCSCTVSNPETYETDTDQGLAC